MEIIQNRFNLKMVGKKKKGDGHGMRERRSREEVIKVSHGLLWPRSPLRLNWLHKRQSNPDIVIKES